MIEEQLNEVKNDEWRVKCVQVYIKCVTPFNISSWLIHSHVFVCEEPQNRGDNNATKNAVDENDVEQEINGLSET